MARIPAAWSSISISTRRSQVSDEQARQLPGPAQPSRLPQARAIAEHLPAALEAAERDKPGYTQFLHDLLAVEVDATEQRRLAGRMRFAGFPSTKTLEEFDFSAQPRIDRALVNEIATLRFVEEKPTCC